MFIAVFKFIKQS